MKAYRRPIAGGTGFRFPFRHGPKSQATGHYNAPTRGRPSKSAPPIKQFTKMRPGGPKKKGR